MFADLALPILEVVIVVALVVGTAVIAAARILDPWCPGMVEEVDTVVDTLLPTGTGVYCWDSPPCPLPVTIGTGVMRRRPACGKDFLNGVRALRFSLPILEVVVVVAHVIGTVVTTVATDVAGLSPFRPLPIIIGTGVLRGKVAIKRFVGLEFSLLSGQVFTAIPSVAVQAVLPGVVFSGQSGCVPVGTTA